MTVEVPVPRDVEGVLKYYAPLNDEPPYDYKVAPPGVLKSNVGEDPRTMLIHDARGKEDDLTLDASGFQFINYPTAQKDFSDEKEIKTVYYAECEEILKKYAGVKRVSIFNHTIRRSSGGPDKVQVPSRRIHVDQSPAATVGRVRDHMGDEAERLLKGRYGIINIWRPIYHPVMDTPLTVVDYRSLEPDKDLLLTRYIDTHREGSLYSVKYNPAHQWYYMSNQTPDEIVVFKSFDSDVNRAPLVPHTSFIDSNCPVGAPERQSIEIRALVFDTE